MIEEELLKILPVDRVRTRLIDRVSFASDAGFYYLLPQAVVHPKNEDEISKLFALSHRLNIPLVFRAGGTSLSGQSVTDGILVDLSQHWNKAQIIEQGDAVRVQPGVTGGMVNAYLRKYRRKIGPDPSSINSAMMGGILSNNSSGMCCGVKLNSYHTCKSIRFVLPDGSVYSTENPQDYDRFAGEARLIFNEIEALKILIRQDAMLSKRIRQKYETKNTVGYSLNAFIDFDHPLDIFAHLLIGGEGTLAFISEATLHTVPDYPYKSTGLLFFPDIFSACSAIVPLTNAGAMMVELMDRASLRAVQDMTGIPDIVRTLPPEASALLIEFQENTPEAVELRVSEFLASCNDLNLFGVPEFTYDPRKQDMLWKVRKGLFPAVGAVRASGTTVILEDIAFPVNRLGVAILDLQVLFQKFNYTNAIIFGHAKDGNIHFVVTQSFHSDAEVQRYDSFIREVVDIVVKKYDGTLKAEHGTGRNMAPFVETEWGGKAYEILKRIKLAIDPRMLLNPGVIINADENAHIKHLKSLPSVEAEVDRCIECGYCEHKCPSRDLTTTPRRRIVIRRVLKELKDNGKVKEYEELLSQYKYDGIETCAVDGLCATACPVDINTGDLIKRLRRENHSAWENKMAVLLARNFSSFQTTSRLGLKAGSLVNKIFGGTTMSRITSVSRKVLPSFPQWGDHTSSPPRIPSISKERTSAEVSKGRVLYFPGCISRIFGTYADRPKNIMETFISICEKVGIHVTILTDANSRCCGQMFSSKGYYDAARESAQLLIDSLWRDSEGGVVPVVTDVSSCAYTFHQLNSILEGESRARFNKITFLDSVDFLHELVLPLAKVKEKTRSVVLHPVCSLQKMKTEDKFFKVAQYFAKEVVVPQNSGCCGMAGDRGFLYPELTDSATHAEASEIRHLNCDGYYSSTKTCEMAMSKAVGKNYESILYLVDDMLIEQSALSSAQVQ